MDGDGSKDEAFVVGQHRLSARGCYYLVFVRTDSATYQFRLGRDSSYWSSLMPYRFFELNGSPGYEVLVQTSKGATGASYFAFTLAGGKLRPLAEPGSNATAFLENASTGYGNSLDCLGDGRLIRTSFVTRGNGKGLFHFEVERDFLRLAGSTLFELREEHFNVPDKAHGNPFAGLDHFGGLFRHCPHP
jgi:hypothetical protein